MPSIEIGQLLRSLPEPREKAGNAKKGLAGGDLPGEGAGEVTIWPELSAETFEEPPEIK